MKIDRLELVKLRNGFYKDGFRRLSFVLLLSVIINLILIIALLVTRNRIPPPLYFASSQDGSLAKLQPLDQPVYNKDQVASWVSRAIPSILQLDFMNYRAQLNRSEKYFTTFGWTQFQDGFQAQLKQIKDQKLVASGVVSGAPVVTRELYLKGTYSWYVQVPVMITFEGANSKATTNSYTWTVLVSRVDNRKNDQLLGIQQVIQS